MSCITKKCLGFLLVCGIVLSLFSVIPDGGNSTAYAKTKVEKTSRKKADKNTFRDVLLYDGQKVTEEAYEVGCFEVGDKGLLSFRMSTKKKKKDVLYPATESDTMGDDIFKNTSISYQNSDSSVIEIDESAHTYQAVTGGSATVTMTMEYEVPSSSSVSGDAADLSTASGSAVEVTTKTMTATMLFIVGNDTSGVTLDRYQETLYLTSDYVDGKAVFSMIGCPDLKYHNIGISSSNEGMDINLCLDLKKPQFTISTYIPGKTTVTVRLNNTAFTIELTVIKLTPSCTSKVLDQGQSFTLRLKNWPETPKWQSTDPKVATVDEKGVVKAKKVGNTIIYMDIQGNRVGCIVSVVKKGISRVVKRATWIGDNWKYSQPLRMRIGYYDCSSLVWKAYRLSGRYVCGAHAYAPVAADIGHWGVRNKRSLGVFREKNIKKLLYLPGDCLLKVRMRSDRYRGIGHIEMITGYVLHGFIGKDPVIYLTWGARDEGYGASRADDFVIRPYN